jgi:hypothetical protein
MIDIRNGWRNMRTYEVAWQFRPADRPNPTTIEQHEDIDALMASIHERTDQAKHDSMILNDESYATSNYDAASVADITDDSGSFTDGR